MNTLENEMALIGKLFQSINDNFSAVVTDRINWADRIWEITVDEGGKTIYAASLEMDSSALEAKLRLIRHELEQMQVAALAGIRRMAA